MGCIVFERRLGFGHAAVCEGGMPDETGEHGYKPNELAQRPKERAPIPSSSRGLDLYRVSVDLVSAVAWPMLVAVLLVAYRQPLREITSALPQKFLAASKVSVGSLSIEIEEKARATGNPVLIQSLHGLSPEAVKYLLEIGRTGIPLFVEGKTFGGPKAYSLWVNDRMPVIRELASRGMLEFGEDLDPFLAWVKSRFRVVRDRDGTELFVPTPPLLPAEERRLRAQFYGLSPLGKQAWDSVLAAVSKELAK